MKRAVVLGAAGFLGYHLIRELVQQEVCVYAVCRPGSAHQERLSGFANVRVISCALEEIGQLPEKCQERGFDVCYHLAWQGACGQERTDSVLQARNIAWTLAAVRSASVLGCGKFVAAGTICENQCGAVVAKSETPSAAFYLLAKEAAYKMTRMECQKRGMPLAWCTFYHPIGKYNRPDQLVASVILKLMNQESPAFGPADGWFDVICAQDLARGMYLAGEKTMKNDRYFIGSGNPKKLREYLELIKSCMHSQVELRFYEYPDDGLPMKYEWLDAEPFMQETGFAPQVSLEDGIAQTCQWLQRWKENAGTGHVKGHGF